MGESTADGAGARSDRRTRPESALDCQEPPMRVLTLWISEALPEFTRSSLRIFLFSAIRHQVSEFVGDPVTQPLFALVASLSTKTVRPGKCVNIKLTDPVGTCK